MVWIPFGFPTLFPASGNNQMGLNGLAYYTNIYPFNNWAKQGNGATLVLNMAGTGPIGPVSFSTFMLTGGTSLIQVTTTAPHGLWNANYTNQPQSPTGTGGVGSWTISVSNVRQGGSGGTVQTGWSHVGNSDVNVTGPNTFCYVGTAGTGTPDYCDISVSLSGNNPINFGSSLYGAADNPLQFIDANGDIQANIANVTSMTWTQTVYSLDFANGANVPVGYSRNGQTFAMQWASGTGTNSTVGGSNATAPSVVPFTWTTSNDTAGLFQTITIPSTDVSNPPKQIYIGPNNSSVVVDGHTGELAAWNAGIYGSPAYESIHKGRCGTLRLMDWFNTNGNVQLNNFSTWNTPSTANYSRGPVVSGVPIECAMQLCNRSNLDPWINIPNGFVTADCVPIMGISKSTAGSNSIVYFGTASGNAAQIYSPIKHPYNPGDQIIISGNTTGVGTPLVSATVTFSAGTPGTVTWPGAGGTMPSFAKGQNVIFPSGANGSPINNGQSYYMTNINQAANTFQVANTLANALANTGLALTGTGTNTATVQINHNQFTIGAVTTYTAELLHCDSSGFGATGGTIQTTGGLVSVYYAGNSVTIGAFGTRPFDLTHYKSQVTALVTKVNSLLNGNLKPHFEWSNEIWNPGFPTNTMLVGQAHNFVDANGVQKLSKIDSWAGMHGYFLSSAYDAIRTFYGGAAGRSRWVGNMGVWGGNPSWTLDQFGGMDTWIAQFNPALTRNDLFDNIATRTYWGPNYKGNGAFLITSSAQPTFTIDAANIAPSTITVASNTNAPQSGAFVTNWAYPFIPILFGGSGTLPTDLATGQPLQRGGSDTTGGVYSQFNISGVDAAGIMTVSSSVTGPALTVGMTVYASTNNGSGSYWTFNARTITAMSPTGGLTGAGGAGTYQLDNATPQTSAARNSMTAFNYTQDSAFYWTLPTSSVGCVGTTFRFASKASMARFSGFISNGAGGAGNTLTVTTPPGAGLPQIAIGKLVGGIGITECTITAGSGTSWTVNGAAQLTTNMMGLGAYTPIVLDHANPGTTPTACVQAGATILRNYANDSIALNASNPASWPNRYSYYDFKINEQLQFGTDGIIGSLLPFGGAPGNAFGLASYFIADCPPLLPPNLNASMPTSPGIVGYEGGPGNNPQGLVPGTNNTSFQKDPQFAEFIPQAVCTTANAACWTTQFNSWKALPTYLAAFGYTGTGSLVVGQMPQFVDAINPTDTFQFTACYVSDDVLGIGSPNWQGGLNVNPALNYHPMLDALASTN